MLPLTIESSCTLKVSIDKHYRFTLRGVSLFSFLAPAQRWMVAIVQGMERRGGGGGGMLGQRQGGWGCSSGDGEERRTSGTGLGYRSLRGWKGEEEECRDREEVGCN